MMVQRSYPMTSSDTKPREEATSIYVANVACMTVALQTLLPSGDSVLYVSTTPCDTPVVGKWHPRKGKV